MNNPPDMYILKTPTGTGKTLTYILMSSLDILFGVAADLFDETKFDQYKQDKVQKYGWLPT